MNEFIEVVHKYRQAPCSLWVKTTDLLKPGDAVPVYYTTRLGERLTGTFPREHLEFASDRTR